MEYDLRWIGELLAAGVYAYCGFAIGYPTGVLHTFFHFKRTGQLRPRTDTD